MSNDKSEKLKANRWPAGLTRARIAALVIVAFVISLFGMYSTASSSALAYSETPTIVASGDYDDGSIHWELDSAGTLTITGTGALYIPKDNRVFSNQPWYSYEEQIEHIVIGEGIEGLEVRSLSVLHHVESVYIASTVKSIDQGALANCYSLTSVTFAPNSQLESLGYAAFGDSPLMEVRIPATVRRIDANAFGKVERISFEPGADPQAIESYDQVNSTWSNGWQVFARKEVSPGYGYYLNLKCIEIPSSVTSIDEEDFYVFETLERVIIGSRELYDVLAQVFAESSVRILGVNADSQTGLHYLITEDSILVQGYEGTDTELVIPASIEGKPVTEIGMHAFDQAAALQVITLPESVTDIGEGAFARVPNLKRVYVPTLDLHDAVTRSGLDSALVGGSYVDGASGLRYMLAGSGVAVTGRDEPCSALVIPESIGGRPVTMLLGTFSNCTGLESVSLPSTLQAIGPNTFEDCARLNRAEIPASVTLVGNGAFSGCRALSQLAFADGSQLETLGAEAFCGCSSLTLVELPATLTDIGANVFQGCDDLAAVAVGSSDDSRGMRCFSPMTIPDACLPALISSASVDGQWAYGQLAYSAKDSCWYRADADGELLQNTLPVFRKVGARAYPCDTSGEILRDDNQLVARFYPDGSLVFQLGNWEDPSKLDSGYHSTMSGSGLSWFRGSASLFGSATAIARNVQLDASLRAVDASCFMNGVLDGLFAGLKNVESIEGFANLAGVQISSASNLFNDCSSLYELDLSALDMSKVTSAQGMFDGCNALASLKLGFLWKNAGTTARRATFPAEAFGMDTAHARHAKGAAIPNGRCEYRMGNGCIPLQLVDVIMDKPTYDYTGKAITPAPELRFGKTVLVKGKDYKVTYTNNIMPGKAKVSIQGKGMFGGGLSASFTIRNVVTAVGDKVIYRTKKATYTFVVTAVKKQRNGNVVPAKFKLLTVQVSSSKTTKLVLPSTCTIGGVVVDVTAVGSKLGGNFRNVSSVVIGAKVTVIAAKAFAKAPKVKKLLLKTKRLRKATKSLKGSKVKTVTAKCKLSKAKRKAYRKMFEKKAGRKGVKFAYKP